MVWSKNCYSSYWLWMQDYRIWFHTWTSIRVCVLCALRNPKAAQRSQSESLTGSTTGWASWKSSTQNRVNCEPETTSLKSTVFPQSLWSRSVTNIVLDNSSCCSEVMNKNELDDRMFIARLTSTHLIYKHCGFGIWVNFDALLGRIIFQASSCSLVSPGDYSIVAT